MVKNRSMAGIWLYGFVWFGAYCYPDLDLLYFVQEYKWDYGESRLSEKAWMLELISDSVQCVFMIGWYVFILVTLRKKVNIGENFIQFVFHVFEHFRKVFRKTPVSDGTICLTE